MPFFHRTLLAAIWAVIFFGLAGAGAIRAVCGRLTPGSCLFWPAAGMVFYAPLAFVCFSITGFSTGAIAITWLLFVGTCLFLSAKSTPIASLQLPSIPARHVIAILLLAAGCAWLPTSTIYPFRAYGGLWTATPLADHVKSAFIDAIVREGMPLKNPFYAPDGHRIALSYSYGWYVLGAIVKRLAHCDGWHAEVAMTWLTAFSTFALLAGLACAMARSVAAGYWLLAVSTVGPFAVDILPILAGPHLLPLIGLKHTHGLEVPWLQLAWAPQHVFSALSIVITLWMCSVALTEPNWRKRISVAVGLSVAAAFESSSWVGGVALCGAMPMLLGAAAAVRMTKEQRRAFSRTILPAIGLCVVCITPLLMVLLKGRPEAEQGHSIGLGIFPSTLLEDHLDLSGNARLIARVILYWIHLLPLSFGVIYLVGFPALFMFRPATGSDRAFRAVAIGGTIGFLLVSQFLMSTIRANDLGWRAANVAEMLMCIFAAVGMTHMFGRPLLASLCVAVLTLGLVATAWTENLPIPRSRPPDDEIALHRAFAIQYQAWKAVRKYTRPGDLVQANPDAFSELPPWPISLPYHLFADRSAAYACDGTGRTYAFMYSWIENRRTGKMIEELFTSDPRIKALKELRWTFNVKAILVTPADGVWSSRVIQDSGIYRLAVNKADFKIYVPVTKHRVKQKPGKPRAG